MARRKPKLCKQSHIPETKAERKVRLIKRAAAANRRASDMAVVIYEPHIPRDALPANCIVTSKYAPHQSERERVRRAKIVAGQRLLAAA
jgi:hypothetical protein